MKLIALMCPVLLLAGSVAGQTVTLKDGKTLTATSLRRSGNDLMITLPPAANTDAGTVVAEIGYPLTTIAKVDFPEPAQIETATNLLEDDKPEEALAQIEPVLAAIGGTKDVPGSWWAQAAFLKVTALEDLKRDPEARPLLNDIIRSAGDPEAIRGARVLLAANLVGHGREREVIEVCKAVVKESESPQTLARAWLAEGRSHLALKEYEPALLAFLHIPVYYPKLSLLMPSALFGAAKAYAGLEDTDRAVATLNRIIKDYSSSTAAEPARQELKRIQDQAKLEQAQK